MTDKSVFEQPQSASVATDSAPSGLEEWTSDRRFFGHPRGLSTLFFTEMWERFSYYGLRPLLVLFMSATVFDGRSEERRVGKGWRSEWAGAGVGEAYRS